MTQKSQGRHKHLPASCFNTCLVRTSPQENFAPALIILNSVFSPSRLIKVTFAKSTISFRPPSCSPALRQALSTSVVHGVTNLPSRTNLRRPRVSTMESLNIDLSRLTRSLRAMWSPTRDHCLSSAKPLNWMKKRKIVVESVSRSVEGGFDS